MNLTNCFLPGVLSLFLRVCKRFYHFKSLKVEVFAILIDKQVCCEDLLSFRGCNAKQGEDVEEMELGNTFFFSISLNYHSFVPSAFLKHCCIIVRGGMVNGAKQAET